jgi:Flp pilus assembly pilin Flp
MEAIVRKIAKRLRVAVRQGTAIAFLRYGSRRAGLTTVEYALLMALLVITAVGTWVAFSQTLKDTLQQVADSFADYAGP